MSASVPSPALAVGVNQCWCFSPALDLLDPINLTGNSLSQLFTPTANSGASATIPDTIDFLLIDSADISHAFLTLSRLHRHFPSLSGSSSAASATPAPPKLHFHFLDSNPTTLARYILFLSIFLDPSLSRSFRAEFFLDLYANALISDRSNRELRQRARLLKEFLYLYNQYEDEIQEIRDQNPGRRCPITMPMEPDNNTDTSTTIPTNHTYFFPSTSKLLKSKSFLSFSPSDRLLLDRLFYFIDLSTLKHKDRDELVNLLDYWYVEPGRHENSQVLKEKVLNDFPVNELRDHRLRGYYGDRYDARVNLMDWDYHMRFTLAQRGIVHVYHYKRWRNTGQAYEQRLIEYKVANKTLASYREAKHKGKSASVEVRGLWNDILVSPYWVWGIQCDRDQTDAEHGYFYERKQEQYLRNSVDLSLYNIKKGLYELECGRQCRFGAVKKGLESEEQREREAIEKMKQQEKEKDKESAKVEVIEDGQEAAADDESEQEKKSESSTDSASASSSASAADEFSSSDLATHYPSALFSFHHGSLSSLYGKSKYQHRFHRVFISALSIQQIAGSENEESSQSTNAFVSLLHSSPHLPAYLTVETVRYFPLKDEERINFVSKACEIAMKSGLKSEKRINENDKWKMMGGPEFLSFSWTSPSANGIEKGVGDLKL